MNPSDFKKISQVLEETFSKKVKSSLEDQSTLLRSVKNDLRAISVRMGLLGDKVEILKEETRESKEELKEVHETVNALFVDMTDVQKQIDGVWDTTKVIDDKITGQNQRIINLETRVAALAE